MTMLKVSTMRVVIMVCSVVNVWPYCWRGSMQRWETHRSMKIALVVSSSDGGVTDDDLLRPFIEDETRSWENDGEKANVGHGYQASNSDDEAKVKDMDRVDELLTLRVLAKKARDYDEADRLKEELFREHRVRVWDRTREWNYMDSQREARGGSSIRREVHAHDYFREAGDTSDVDLGLIDTMLLDRLRAKMRRDFERADEIREELRGMGIRVDDGKKQWRGGVPLHEIDPWRKPRMNYERKPSVDEVSTDGEINLLPVDENLVRSMLTDRHEARRTQFWKRADELLDDLLKMGIDVDDSTRSWSKVKTAYSLNARVSSRSNKKHFEDYQQIGIQDDPRYKDKALIQQIEQLMAERRRAKIRRQFDEADAIREDLRDLGVYVNDRKRTWTFSSDRKRKHQSNPQTASSSSDTNDNNNNDPPQFLQEFMDDLSPETQKPQDDQSNVEEEYAPAEKFVLQDDDEETTSSSSQ